MKRTLIIIFFFINLISVSFANGEQSCSDEKCNRKLECESSESIIENKNDYKNAFDVADSSKILMLNYTPMDLDFSDFDSYTLLINSASIYYETAIKDCSGEVTNIARYENIDDKQPVSIGLEIPLESVKFYTDPTNIEAILDNEGVEKVKSIYHIRCRNLYTDVILIDASDDYYAIPFGHGIEGLYLENYELYKAEDVFKEMQDYYKRIESGRNTIGYKVMALYIKYREQFFSVIVLLLAFIIIKKLGRN